MRVIKPDYDRRIEIPGVPKPVSRPVDIDQSKTGFTKLRTLRIYRFDPDSVIDGHAEEDEVFIILLAGKAEVAITANGEECEPRVLSAAPYSKSSACAAYLPPNAAYRLVSRTECDVAYARATPDRGRSPKYFFGSEAENASENQTFFEDLNYAERLRVRLVQKNSDEITLSSTRAMSEVLVHVRDIAPGSHANVVGAGFPEARLDSWDTAALTTGERATLKLTSGSSALVLVVLCEI